MDSVHVRARQVDQALRLCPLGVLVDVHVAVGALLLQHKVLRLPLLFLILKEAMISIFSGGSTK